MSEITPPLGYEMRDHAPFRTGALNAVVEALNYDVLNVASSTISADVRPYCIPGHVMLDVRIHCADTDTAETTGATLGYELDGQQICITFLQVDGGDWHILQTVNGVPALDRTYPNQRLLTGLIEDCTTIRNGSRPLPSVAAN